MQHYTRQGTWWLPGKQARSVEGTLSFGAGGIELLVHGALSSSSRQGRPPVTYGVSDWKMIPVIHGRTVPDRKPMTLLNVEGDSYVAPPGVEVENNYQVGVALSDTYTARDSFTELICTFDCLNAWAQPASMINYTESMEDITVQFQDIELASARVKNAKIRLVVTAVGTTGRGSVHLDQVVKFKINVPAATAASIVGDWVRPLQDFLTVSLSRPVRLTSLYFRPTRSRTFAEADFDIVQAGPGPSPTQGAILSYSAPTLLTLADSPVPFSRLMPRWFETRSEYREVLNLLLAPYYTSFIFSDHRYASTFQSAEALANTILLTSREMSREAHLARVSAIIEAAEAANVKEEDIAWARRVLQARNDKPLAARVTEFVTSLGVIGNQVLTACPDFSALVTRARTSVSHPTRSGLSNVERYRLGEVLNWLVRAKMLIETGLPVAEVEQRVSHRAAFQHALTQIQSIRRDR